MLTTAIADVNDAIREGSEMDKLLEQAWNLTPEQRQEYEKHLMPFHANSKSLHLKSGKGVWLEDIHGKKYIDFTTQMFACYLGFGNEEIAQVVYEQAKSLTIVSPFIQTDLRYSLVHKIASVAPKNLNRISFTVGGGPATESAMKIAIKNIKGSRNFVTLGGSYHGGTFASANATSFSSQVANDPNYIPALFRYVSAMPNNCVRAPQPYCYRCPFKQKPESCGMLCAEMLKYTILNGVVGPAAGVFVEPIQSAGGQMPFPKEYLRRVREICDETGTLLIFDEFQTYCRTGKFFAADYYGVEPDIITFAKGLGGGIPLAGIIIHDRLVPFEEGMEDLHTFQNVHLGMAAALKAIEITERDGLLENAENVGAYITQRLFKMQEEFPEIGDIRGPGLAIGVELVKDPVTKEPLSAGVILDKCMEKGLFFQIAHSNIIKIKPALIITKNEADTALDILEESLREVLRK